MKQLIFIILFLFSPCIMLPVSAKEDKDQMKANYYYAHYAYNQAIPFFEKLGESATTPGVFEKLGDCYRLTGHLDKAAEVYAKATSMDGYNDNTVLNYGLVLMRLAQYDEAAVQFRKYAEKHPTDTRTMALVKSCHSAAERARTEFPSGVTWFAPFNSDGSEFAPTLWKGNLVFTSDSIVDTRKGTDKWSGNAYYGIYSIPCTGPGNYGTEITKISGPKELNIKYHTGPCTFTADGKQMYYTRSKYSCGLLSNKAVGSKDSTVLLEIMIASDYDEAEKRFKVLTPFQHNSNSYSVAHPALSPNGHQLIFSSDMPHGSGGRDLYLCTSADGKTWARPLHLDSVINTEGDEVFPWWGDDTTLYFSSDGHEGMGGLDIYRTHYNGSNSTWSLPENMPLPLNSSYDEISLSMTANGGSGYFSSNRPAAKGGDNIYYYKRTKVLLQVMAIDSATHKPITAHITSRSQKSNKEDNIGPAKPFVEQLWPNINYDLAVTKEGYKPVALAVSAVLSGTYEQDTIIKNIALAPIIQSWDSTFAVTVTESPPTSRPGIMDSPGISTFEVNKVYVIGFFDFNFSKFYYKANKTDVNFEKKVVLDTLANILRRHPTMAIQIQAHTDCRGTDEYNMKLSIDRAASVVTYLLKKGIAPDRLEYKGFGETAPVVPCPDCKACTEEEHAQNRVLEFKVLRI